MKNFKERTLKKTCFVNYLVTVHTAGMNEEHGDEDKRTRLLT